MSMRHMLVAGSLLDADRSATKEFGWSRIGRHSWRNLVGEEVTYLLHDQSSARGWAAGTKVYLGFGSKQHPCFAEIEAGLASGRLIYGLPTQ